MSLNFRPRVFNTPKIEVTSPLDDVILPAQDFRDELPVLGDTLPEDVEAEVYTSVTVRIPQSLYEEYRKVAAAQEVEVEDVIQHRLSQCRSHNARRGLWFSDLERGQLEDLIQKRPLENAGQVLSSLLKGGTFKLDDLEISLTPAQRKVLKLAMFGGRTPQKFFEDMVRRELRV